MTEPSLPLMDSFLLSPRTASYIDALIREGDKFDYSKWLQRVREGEAQAKQGPTKFISEGLVAAEIGDQTGTSDGIWAEPQADDQSRVDFESASAGTSCTQRQSTRNQHSAPAKEDP